MGKPKKPKKNWDPFAAYLKRKRRSTKPGLHLLVRDADGARKPTQADVTVGQLRKALRKIRRDPRFKDGDYIVLEFRVGTNLQLQAVSMKYGKRSKKSLTGVKPLHISSLVGSGGTLAEAVNLFWKADKMAREQWVRRETANARGEKLFGPPRKVTKSGAVRR